MAWPTKKVIAIFVICLVLVGGLFVFLESKNRQETYSKKEMGAVAVIQNKILEQDTDRDGLKDWEETLWKTDSKNPDTDGDGTPDGQEVKDGRDPTKAGPNDKMNIAAPTVPKTTKPLTASDQFSRELFSRYVQIKQSGSGEPADFQNYSDLVNTYIEKESAAQPIKTYGAADFRVIGNAASKDTVRYADQLGAIFVNDKSPDFENELVVLERATDNGNPAELNKLDKNIAAYKKIRTGLLQMPVPDLFLPNHLALTNAVETIIFGIESMKLTFSDPIKAIAGLKNYPDAASSFLPLLRSIGDGLDGSGATFAQDSLGFRFINLVKYGQSSAQ